MVRFKDHANMREVLENTLGQEIAMQEIINYMSLRDFQECFDHICDMWDISTEWDS